LRSQGDKMEIKEAQKIVDESHEKYKEVYSK
jgi:hypothetical protein